MLGAAALLRVSPGLAVESAGASPRLDDGDLLDVWAPVDGGADLAATRKRGAPALSGAGDLLAVTLRVAEPMTGPGTVTLDRLTLGTAGGSVPADPATVALASPFAVAGGDDGAAAFGIASVAPNPLRGRAEVRFGLDGAAETARVAVYDALGREVAVLHHGPLAAGGHGRSLDAGGLAPGVYVVRLTAGDQADARTLTVVR